MKRKLVLMTSALMTIGLLAACRGNSHDHEWGEATYTWAKDYSTCTALRVCKGDESHKEEETVNSVYQVTTSATCEAAGEGKYTATFENKAFEAQIKTKTIEAKGHKWGTPTYNWSNDYSSCTATRVCENDSNHKESETADSAYTVIIPATCNVNGSAVYDVAFESEVFEAQSHEITLPATGHSWGVPTYNWSNDYSSCTATRVCAIDPNHIESETVDSTSVETPASIVVEGSITYTATFTNGAFSTQTYKQKTSDRLPSHGEAPLLSDDGKTLTYGLYPQSQVTNDSTLTALRALDSSAIESKNGYYKYSDDYYAPEDASALSTTDWYLCEPITWQILNSSSASTDGYYYVVSDQLLDTHCYYEYNGHGFGPTETRTISGESHGIYHNNYEYSDIRAWLNGLDGSSYSADNCTSSSFYKSAFGLNDSHIMEWDVSHIASTTANGSNTYAAGGANGSKNTTTRDKVSLLSYAECVNYFDSDNSRKATATAYAVAKGAYTSSAGGYGYYWTRSPYSNNSNQVSDVKYTGVMDYDSITLMSRCVRPAISIEIA